MQAVCKIVDLSISNCVYVYTICSFIAFYIVFNRMTNFIFFFWVLCCFYIKERLPICTQKHVRKIACWAKENIPTFTYHAKSKLHEIIKRALYFFLNLFKDNILFFSNTIRVGKRVSENEIYWKTGFFLNVDIKARKAWLKIQFISTDETGRKINYTHWCNLDLRCCLSIWIV